MRKAILLLSVSLLFTSALGQGALNISPVSVTNSLTGLAADSGIVAGLYYGPAGSGEASLVLLSAAAPLVGGQAEFGNGLVIPLISSGASAVFQVRAWSLGYPTYETAVGSGLGSVLAGESVVLSVTLGSAGGAPPIPSPLSFPGFAVSPVPEPGTAVLVILGGGMLFRRRNQRGD